jgi:two-component system cell cycle response regulator DivK
MATEPRPTDPEVPREVVEPMQPPTSARGKREALPLVLVVDDFDDNRLLYATTIAEAGYPVEEASNGAEALAKIGAIRPAVIIMDLSMPVLDGWEATRRLKRDPRTADIVVIAVTGHTTNYGLHQAREAGADAVLIKPCLPQDLLGVIRTLVNFEIA